MDAIDTTTVDEVPATRRRPKSEAAEPRSTTAEAARGTTRTLNLALQGGGAHGAFGWGVLDRLLEDERIAFEGVSATSAGAMNAVVLAYGLAEGGREGARRALAGFWRRVAHAGAFSPLQPSWWDRVTHNHRLDFSPAFLMFDMLSRVMSPYHLNPFNHNPLRTVLDQSVDFDRLRAKPAIKLYLTATNVRSGKVRIFDSNEITADAVMASACLPFLFQAVEIDGEHYWDGGYMGNPAIFPLIYGCEAPDVLVVHINPLVRDELPVSATEIMNRINEISFNSSLMREMRAIEFVTRLIDGGDICSGRLKRMNVHAIVADEVMRGLSVSSKMNADWEFLTHLRDDGREYAGRWIETHLADVGSRSTVDLRGIYL